MSSRASRYQKRRIQSDHDTDEIEKVTLAKKKPVARAPASEPKKKKQAAAANVAAKKKAAAAKLAAKRLAADEAAAAELAADADEALDDGNDPVDDGTLYAIIVEEEAKKPKEGDTRLWMSLKVSPDDPRNEPTLDKLRKHARYAAAQHLFRLTVKLQVPQEWQTQTFGRQTTCLPYQRRSGRQRRCRVQGVPCLR